MIFNDYLYNNFICFKRLHVTKVARPCQGRMCKTMRHNDMNDTKIFHYVHYAPLSIYNVLTQPFFMV